MVGGGMQMKKKIPVNMETTLTVFNGGENSWLHFLNLDA